MKASEENGIFLEFIKYDRPNTSKRQVSLHTNNLIATGNLPTLMKQTKIIVKPGKIRIEASNNSPIALLSSTYYLKDYFTTVTTVTMNIFH